MINPHWSIYVILLWIPGFICPNQAQESTKYLGQDPPGLTPKIFAESLISKKESTEFGSVFSKDATEFFYAVDIEGKSEIRSCRLEGKSWSQPIQILVDSLASFNDPFLSPDESSLYFISDQPLIKPGNNKDIDIWYVIRDGKQWSAPIHVGSEINSDKDEYYISFTSNSSMYFASNKLAGNTETRNFDIYRSSFENNQLSSPERLSDSINTPAYEADVFVAPDESYLIFCSIRRGGHGKGDLYISFKNKAGEWTQAQNMGEPVNSIHHELCPFVTRDGKYLFYTSNHDIYWVDAGILKNYQP